MLLLQSHRAGWMLSNNEVEEGLGLAEALHAEKPDQLRDPSRSVFQANLEAAYLNSSRDYWQSEERDVAISLLEACIIRLPVAEQCHQRLQDMRQVLL